MFYFSGSSRAFTIFFRRIITIFKELLINEQIHSSEVRLLDENGTQIGVLPLAEALSIAETKEMDLVLMNASSNPVVCKIMDYGKYKYDLTKKEKEIKKNQKISQLKEIQLRMSTDVHDLETKARHGNKFLQSGDKLKVVLTMKGREQAYAKKAEESIRRFFLMLAENGVIDKQPERMGKRIVMIVTPKTK